MCFFVCKPLKTAAKVQKKKHMCKKNAKKFGQFKKKQYLCTRFSKKKVSLAQLVEQLTLNQWVESSSLSGDTKGTNPVPFFISSFFLVCERKVRVA